MCGRAACNCDDQAIYRSTRQLQSFDPKIPSPGASSVDNHTRNNWSDDIRWTNKTYFTPFEGNIAPGDYVTLIHPVESRGNAPPISPQNVELRTVKWGIKGPWSHLIINARADTVSKSTFFHKTAGKRAIICVTGYMEWFSSQNVKSPKQPYYFYPKSNRDIESGEKTPIASELLLWIAAIWDGESRCVILTTSASRDVSWCHHRMPAVLASKFQAWNWINPSITLPEALKCIVPGEGTLCWHKIRPDFAQKFRRIKSEPKNLEYDDTNSKKRKIETGKVLKPYSAVTLENFLFRGGKEELKTLDNG